ncbi:Uncharacterised protein [Mycobacterium tuberculosis]|nr:Uncharacterised protein [Mycobacterium tuberculosis]
MLDPTVSMLAFTESIGEVERSTAKATANWATKPKIRPGMTQSRPPMKVTATISSPVTSTRPRLRGLKNVAMVTGFPSAMSRQPVRIPACM